MRQEPKKVDNAAYARLEELSNKYKELQERIEQSTSAQSQLAAQKTENDIVLEELKNMDEDSQVYKLIGPVLAKQTKEESIDNVEKRLNFIKEEMERIESANKSNKVELDKLVQLIQKQQELQHAAA